MQKNNFGSFAGGNQRILFNELEYALETTTLFGQKPKRSSQRKAVIRDFNSVSNLVPVAQPQYVLVPAAEPFGPSVQGGIQTFIYPNSNQTPNQQPQGLNIYQRPAVPFVVPSPFSHNQTCNQRLPACNSPSSTLTKHCQPPKSGAVLGTCTHSQRIVQVPTATPKVVSNSANVPGPPRPSSKPVRPPKRTLIIEKDIFAPGAENQRMINLRDLMALPPHHTDKNEAKITYSILPRSRSKKTCHQPKRVDLRTLMAEPEAQSHDNISSTNEVNKGCSTSMLKVSGPPKKKAKIEHQEDDLDVRAMYQLLAESIDLRAALAGGEIRIEEHNNSGVKPSPVVQQTTVPESKDAASHPHHLGHSQSTPSDVSVDAAENESKGETSEASEEKEIATLEEIFSLDKSETQALFEDSFKDVDLDGMRDTYLYHEEQSSVDNNCLREILDSAEFAELFESSAAEDPTTGSTTTHVATQNHPSEMKGSFSSVGDDLVELIDSDDDSSSASTDTHPSTTEGSLSSDDDLDTAGYASTMEESLSFDGTEFFDMVDSDDDTPSRTGIVHHSSTIESSLSSVGISTIPPTETRPSAIEERENPVDFPEVTPKPRSSMTIEELFLSNRQRVLKHVAENQEQEHEPGSLDSDELTTPPSNTEVLDVLETTNGDPFPDYIPDMFLFSAMKPDVVLHSIGQTAPPNMDQPFMNEIRTPPSPGACFKQPVGHYHTVPEGPLDMMRADNNVYLEMVYKAEGIQYVFDEFKIPGNNIIVDPATLQTPRPPSPGRKRPRSHDCNYICDDSQSAKRFKVDAGNWVTCSNSANDSEKSKMPKRRYDNKAHNLTEGLGTTR